jgi:hypothetical protein
MSGISDEGADTKSGASAQTEPPQMTTVLGSLPPTDPAILKAFRNGRLVHQHYAAIGQVAALWAYFESVVDFWLVTFAGLEPEVGVCFTAQMSGTRGRINGFIALVRHLGAGERWDKQLTTLADDTRGLADQRNRAVHDVWDLSEAESPQRREASAQRRVRILKIHVSTEDIRRLAGQIDALRRRFDDVADNIFTEIHTSPGIPPPDIEP